MVNVDEPKAVIEALIDEARKIESNGPLSAAVAAAGEALTKWPDRAIVTLKYDPAVLAPQHDTRGDRFGMRTCGVAALIALADLFFVHSSALAFGAALVIDGYLAL